MIYMIEPHSRSRIGMPLNVKAMSLTLNGQGGNATLTMDDLAQIQDRELHSQWFVDTTDPGKDIVWREKNYSDAKHTKTPTVQLEHVINVLKDTILFDEVTPETITGVKDAEKCTAQQAIQYVLNRQPQKDWVLYNFDSRYTQAQYTQEYSFQGTESLFDAITNVSATLDDCFWDLDTSVYPFRISFRMLDDSEKAKTQMRASRNIRTLSVTKDKTGMYTRFYPVGNEDLHYTDPNNENIHYVNMRTSKYGVIEKTETDESLKTNDELYNWARAKLSRHSKPIVKIEVEGLELSDATGVPLDKITIGRTCDAILSDNDEFYHAQIIEKSYTDKINQPEVVKVTMSNQSNDVTKLISRDRKETAKTNRVQSRINKKNTEKLNKAVEDVKVTGPVDNIYTLIFKRQGDSDYKNGGTFSRAVTSWEVSASKGTIKVTAQPQKQSKEVQVRQGTMTLSGKKYSGTIEYSKDDRKVTSSKKEWLDTEAAIEVDASEVYANGWAEARKRSDSPTDETTNKNYIVVHVVPAKVDGTKISRQYNLRDTQDDQGVVDNNRVDLVLVLEDEQFTTVARYNHGKYNLGWSSARSRSDSPTTLTTNRNYIVVHVVPATVDGSAEARQYNLRDATDDEVNFDNNRVDLAYRASSDPDTFITVARYNHGKYNLGWGNARSRSDSPTTLTTNRNYIVVHVVPATVGGAAEARQYNLRDATDDEVNFDNNRVDLAYRASSDPDTFITVARYNHGKYNLGWSSARSRSDSPTTLTTNRNYIVVHVVPATVDGSAEARQYNLRDATDDGVNYDNNRVDLAYRASSDPDTFITVARYNHGKYNAGWGAARNCSDAPTTETTNRNYIVVHVVPSTVGGSAEARQYNLRDNDNNNVDLAYKIDNDTFTTVARYNHGKYNLGWGAARNCSDAPTTETTNRNYIVVHVVPSTVGGSAIARQYNLTDHNNNNVDLAYKIDNDTFTTVARYNHGKYNAGWGAARNCSDSPTTESTSTNYIVVHVVPSTVGGSAIARQYNLTDHNNNNVDLVYKEDNDTFITVARYNHGKYTAGKKAATVTLSYGTVTVDSAYQKHVDFKATNDDNTSHNDTMTLYLVKNGTTSQLRKGSAGGTLIMEINNT